MVIGCYEAFMSLDNYDKDKGFYAPTIHKDMSLTEIELSEEEWQDALTVDYMKIVDDNPPPPYKPTPEELAAQRKAEILSQLNSLDMASIRPLRAIVDGVATDDDRARLREIEAEVGWLRAEMTILSNTNAAGAEREKEKERQLTVKGIQNY